MVTRLRRRTSRSARWGLRFSRFAIPVLILTAIFHRVGILTTQSMLALYAITWVMALAAIILGVIGLISIWSYGLDGARRALAGIGLALPIIAIPIYFGWLTLNYPAINDISTNPIEPPGFIQLDGVRPADANPIDPVFNPEHIVLQREAYPEIRPLFLGTSIEDTYEAALRVVADQDWRVIVLDSPELEEADEEISGEVGAPTDGESATVEVIEGVARIQAVAKTLVSGFSDDIVIVISSDEGDTRVDVRSTSRYGEHDFGVNASRIRSFMIELQQAVAPTLSGT